MKIQLIQGKFQSADAIKLISDMIQIKVKFQATVMKKKSSTEKGK